MKILLIAPNPFVLERGTPLAARMMTETLAGQGHRVDVLTYHEGVTPEIAGVRIFRIGQPPLVDHVPIGFSWQKLVCDVFLTVALVRRLLHERYDLIHAIEEAAYLGWLTRAVSGTPFVYDMDSSLAGQILENKPLARPLGPLLNFMERRVFRRAVAVTPVCEALAELAREAAPATPVHVIEDVAIGDTDAEVPSLRDDLGIVGPMLLYVGNLEQYQGIDLMLDAFADVVRSGGPGDLVVVGGLPEHIAAYRGKTSALGLDGRVHWTGPRPVEQLPGLLQQADVLLSPRLTGVNTPMKVYSYLASGVPIAATRIESHTQVLDDEVAVLTDAEPAAYGAGIRSLLEDGEAASELGRRARERALEHYSPDAYRRKVASMYAEVGAALAAQGRVAVAEPQ